MTRDRYGDPVEPPEPEPDRDDPGYQAWWKSWLDYCRQQLKEAADRE